MVRAQQRYGQSYMVMDRSGGSNIMTRLSEKEFEAFDAVARQRDISRSALLRQVVREFMATMAKEP
jgi:Ribbon-helix-helix protein, copG family